MMVVVQSMSLASPDRTETGSCGLGCTGGGATNWKRKVVSPTTTLPRASSLSGTWYACRLPKGTRLACAFSAARSEMPVLSATRPVMPSRKFR